MAQTAESIRIESLRDAERKAHRLFDEVVARGLITVGVSERQLSDQIRDLAAEMFGPRSSGTSASFAPAPTPWSPTPKTRPIARWSPTTSCSSTSGPSSPSGRPTSAGRTSSETTRPSIDSPRTYRGSGRRAGALRRPPGHHWSAAVLPRDGTDRGRRMGPRRRACRTPGRRIPPRAGRRRQGAELHRARQHQPDAEAGRGRPGVPLDSRGPPRRPERGFGGFFEQLLDIPSS